MDNKEDYKDFLPIIFPPPIKNGGGIVTITEELNFSLLYSAYIQGIFPWYNEDEGENVIWWSPDPRFILVPDELHIPERLNRFLNKNRFTYTMDKAFKEVIKNCANVKRPGQKGTWIGSEMIKAYCELFYAGIAHSIEVWNDNRLVGGFYGVLIGQVFCGESMFTLEPNATKSAFVKFVQAFKECGGKLIDSQVYTDNIARFGGKNISRDAFLYMEKKYLHQELTKPLKETFCSFANNNINA